MTTPPSTTDANEVGGAAITHNGRPDVKHMKWWGWGVEGVAFHFDDKPKFAPFVKKAVGLDLSGEAPPPIRTSAG
ncbi:hypothetical protein [Microlunatus sp. Gsoil 973]|uniref:hypothetical protein n=1 Tax=Microlunatus sp. Gsoil 973 TaxID=2672569 RepID=UPI001E44366B|nr:hypothetical protein [Microlunatus sp. Gsoil 973]